MQNRILNSRLAQRAAVALGAVHGLPSAVVGGDGGTTRSVR